MRYNDNGNWAVRVVRAQMNAGASNGEIAAAITRAPEFLQAVKEGREGNSPHVAGADGATHIIRNLIDALQESEAAVTSLV